MKISDSGRDKTIQIFIAIYVIVLTSVCLYLDLSYPFIFGLIPIIFVNREWLITVLLIPSLVDGVLNRGQDLAVPLGVLNVILLAPVLLIDNIKSTRSIPLRQKTYFTLFIILLLLGTIVYGFRFQFGYSMIMENIQVFMKLVFFMILLKFLINKNLMFIENSINNLIYCLLPLILVVIFYTFEHGISDKFWGYVQFGDSKHGTFTAVIVAFSVYAFYQMVVSKNLIYKLFFIAFLIIDFYFILQQGSKNGLLSFGVMVILGLFLLITNISTIRKISIIFISLSAILIIIFFAQQTILNSPTLVRLIGQYNKGGVEQLGSGRAELWDAGFEGFLNAPFIGWGGSSQSARYVSANFGDVNKPNAMHNIFIDFTVQYGLVGTLLLLSFIIFVFKNGKTVYYFTRKRSSFLIFLPVLSGLMLLFSGMFVPWMWNTLIWYHYIIILALAFLCERESKLGIEYKKAI